MFVQNHLYLAPSWMVMLVAGSYAEGRSQSFAGGVRRGGCISNSVAIEGAYERVA